MTEDCCAIADALHFFQTVADVKDGAALCLQLEKRLEELVCFLRGQHRGGLVENDKLRVLQECADDLDTLALSYGQVGNMGVRVERKTVSDGQFGRLLCQLRDRDLLIERQRDVFSNRQRLEQGEMLKDHADAEATGGGGIGNDPILSLPSDRPGGRCKNTKQHLDQSGLPGPVLTEQRMDFTMANVEIYAITGLETTKQLREAPHSQKRIVALRRLLRHRSPLHCQTSQPGLAPGPPINS